MTFRSILIVPSPDSAAMRRAASSGADVLVAAGPTGRARDALAGLAATPDGGPSIWLRIAPLDDPRVEDQFAAIGGLRVDALVLPCADGPEDVEHLAARLAVVEADAGLRDGSIGIVPVVETSGALFEINRLARASRRVTAIGWDGEALARDLGSDDDRELDGRWSDPLQTARALVLAACADARLPAIDSPFSGADPAAFREEAETAARDGFAAKFAVLREQTAIIASAFVRRG